MLDALRYMHLLGFIHRDIKPENILVDKDGYPKIGDFGLSKRILNKTNTFCGTSQYMAPEIAFKGCRAALRSRKKYQRLSSGWYNSSVDYWSLGVILHEMITGENLFECQDERKTYFKVVRWTFKNRHTRFRWTSEFKDTLVTDVIERLMDPIPSKRLGMVGDPRTHPWFDPIDWVKLRNREIKPPCTPC